MDINRLRSMCLNYVNDQMEVRSFGDGFMVWLPTRYADDDAVSLSVVPSAGGWMISDDGTTYSRLLDAGVPLTTGMGSEAWARLARPGTGWVPNDTPEDGCIKAVGEEKELASLLWLVGNCAVRAEALEFTGRRTHPRPFASKVTDRLNRIISSTPGDYIVRPGGKVRLNSGRERRMTATLERDNNIALALQAVGGRSREARVDSHDACYAAFGPSRLPRERRLAIAIGNRAMWEPGLIEELEEVTPVAFFDSQSDVDRAVKHALMNA